MVHCVITVVVKLIAWRRIILAGAAWIARFGYLLFIFYGLAEWFRPGAAAERLRRRRTLVYCLFAVSFASTLSLCIGKLWHRPRPFAKAPKRPSLIPHKANASFPSNHAMNSMAASLVLMSHGNRAGAFLAVWGMIIGASRVICRLHYATDVAGGFVIGAISALAVRRSAAARRWATQVLWICGGIADAFRIWRRNW